MSCYSSYTLSVPEIVLGKAPTISHNIGPWWRNLGTRTSSYYQFHFWKSVSSHWTTETSYFDDSSTFRVHSELFLPLPSSFTSQIDTLTTLFISCMNVSTCILRGYDHVFIYIQMFTSRYWDTNTTLSYWLSGGLLSWYLYEISDRSLKMYD